MDALKGHDFSRAANAAKSVRALAPEGILVREINLISASLSQLKSAGEPD